MDLDVGKWLRKHASGLKISVVLNKAELLDEITGSLASAVGEAYRLGFGDPTALSAETGLGMAELYSALRPLIEDYVLHSITDMIIFTSNETVMVLDSRLFFVGVYGLTETNWYLMERHNLLMKS